MCDAKPVSVIIPTYNEEDSIIGCIKSLLAGDYPVDKLEFIFADGGSSDNTLKRIEDFVRKNPDVTIKVVNNPHRTQGYGLNIAIEKVDTQSEIIIRADAHSIYPHNYIMDCVKTILTVDAENVGGVMVPIGRTHFQKAVAFCMSNPLGVGDAKFHLGVTSGFVDTVYLSCFKKDVLERVGLFDPKMTPNEDAEFNLRILKSGGKIYLNSKIKVQYFPQDTITGLGKQYFRYGQGRCRTFKKHKRFTSVRQVIPPTWVVFSLITGFMSSISNLFLIPLLVYLSVLLIVSVYGIMRNHCSAIMLSPLCLIIMHYAWGIGFLLELLKRGSKNGVWPSCRAIGPELP